jgi:ribonuclease HIII
MPDLTTYTKPLTGDEADTLKRVLQEEGFTFESKPYCLFAANKGKVNVLVYEKGPKVVIQGKDTQGFILNVLEPLVLKKAELGYEEVNNPEMFSEHIGVDESGKGDFFGPLVIAGVWVDTEIVHHLRDLGVMDSKRISSEKRISALARQIMDVPGIALNVVTLQPLKYNELYGKFKNLNRLLAWGHSTVIENLLGRKPGCPQAVSDQFADPAVLQRALKERGRAIELVQRTKAESDPAVAAASIIARHHFVQWLAQAGENYGGELPKGVSEGVKDRARAIAKAHGPDVLKSLCKTHFKTYAEVAD